MSEEIKPKKKNEPLEIKLSEEETYALVSNLTNFYDGLDTIQDYFLERKKEKVININPDDYTDEFFTDYSVEPKDMDISVEVIDGKTFSPSVQLVTSLPLESQIGRQITLGVKENNTDKWIGFIRLASPVLMIKPRNEVFGGVVRATQVNRSMLNGAIIVPVQPFGYNYLGGKLLSLLCCSHEMKRQFDEKYGTDLKYFETTSLYGTTKGVSMYDGLKPFVRYIGDTDSNFLPLFHDDYFRTMFQWFNEKANDGERLVSADKSGKKLKIQQKMIAIIKKSLNDKDKLDEFVASIAHAKSLTEQKRTYLGKFGYEPEEVIEWWKKKASKRYDKLVSEGRLRTKLELWSLNSNLQIIR